MRQIIDSKFIYSFTKPFEMKKLEDLSFFCTMDYAPGIEKSIDPRLLVNHLVLKSFYSNGIIERALFV